MNRWQEKANALWSAWVTTQKVAPPNYNALRMVLAQAEAESQAGDCWEISHNWGCCDLRALNAAERDAFAAGTLKIGYWLYPDGSWGSQHHPDSVGTVRGDSDPNTGAFKVWFYAAPTDEQGAAYMLHAGVRGTLSVLSDPDCSPATYAADLYVRECYYGGVHAGARPCGHRSMPLNAAEQKNADDYTAFISKHLDSIDAGLVGWIPPGPYSGTTEVVGGDNTGGSAGDDIGQASVDEGVTE